MTVGELKKALEDVDDDLPVWVFGSDQCANEADSVEVETKRDGEKRLCISA
jgi:hypothetical protein